MIIGSGLLAKAFAGAYEAVPDVCIYAAGVSNSSCTDQVEFDREKNKLAGSLQSQPEKNIFVYFSTCSIYDPDMQETAYVKHKLAMEKLVRARGNYIIARLPQIVGVTPNPHTLLNYLYARIVRSERFRVWAKAKRNIIDVDDVVSVLSVIINDPGRRGITVNISNTCNYTVMEIVQTFERVLEKKAIYYSEDKGSVYNIDVTEMLSVLDRSGVRFDGDYLTNVVKKYYGKRVQ